MNSNYLDTLKFICKNLKDSNNWSNDVSTVKTNIKHASLCPLYLLTQTFKTIFVTSQMICTRKCKRFLNSSGQQCRVLLLDSYITAKRCIYTICKSNSNRPSLEGEEDLPNRIWARKVRLEKDDELVKASWFWSISMLKLENLKVSLTSTSKTNDTNAAIS